MTCFPPLASALDTDTFPAILTDKEDDDDGVLSACCFKLSAADVVLVRLIPLCGRPQKSREKEGG